MAAPDYTDLTLHEAALRLIVVPRCEYCGRCDRLDLWAMVGKLGTDYPLAKLLPRLTCSRCYSRRSHIRWHIYERDSQGGKAWRYRKPMPGDEPVRLLDS